MMFETIISCKELHVHADDPRWFVADCRHDLADIESGSRAYLHSHIPGARFLHLDRDLSGAKTGNNGRHPLPDAATFSARLALLGMHQDTQVVAYDASGGIFAARLWWMLRWLGHTNVAVLDGGWQAWCGSGLPVEAAVPAPAPGNFAGRPLGRTVDANTIMRTLGQTGIQLLDARSPDRFRGENETLDPVAGHIPGAFNRFCKNNLAADGRFKSREQLKREFAELLSDIGADRVVHQCGSGVTACHNLLAMEIAGFKGSSLYPGSWSEWCSDPARPVAR